MKKDILFAILAAHNSVITERQLLDIGVKWASHPDKSLVEMIREEISEQQFKAISLFVKMAIKRHNDNVEETLSEIAKIYPAAKKVVKTLSAVRNHIDLDNDADKKQSMVAEDVEKTIENFVELVSHPEIDSVHSDKRELISFEQEGKYEIKGEHSRGGSGRVLVAYDFTIGRDIAMKELIPDDEKEEGTLSSLNMIAKRDRFIREVRVTGQLQHPSIVPVYEIGCRKDGNYYYTMKLVKGKTLKRAISECSSLEDALLLLPHFRDLCHAVSFAHANKVIHRDLKPENVMIGEFGETVLLDWGIAKIEGEQDNEAETLENCINQLKNLQTGQTIAGHAIGTPSYMSPEQARGEIEDIDRLSDIYSLGAVLYEILTGHPPFQGFTGLEIINKVVNQSFAPFSKEKNPPPKALQAIVKKALQKKKEKRYQTVEELVADIEAYMSGEKVSVHTYSTSELLKLFIKQHKAFVVSLQIILMILIIAGITTYQQYRKAVHNEKVALHSEKVALQSLEKEKEAVKISKYHYAQALLREAKNFMKEKDKNSANIYASASLLNNPAHVKSEFYSPEFKEKYPETIYFRASADSILYRNEAGIKANLEQVMEHDDGIYSVAISPDGSKIVSGSYDKTMRLWDMKTGAELIKIEAHAGRVFSVAFSPDGSRIVSGNFDSTIRLWDVQTGKKLKIIKGHTDRVLSVVFSADGNQILSGSNDRTIRLWDVKTGKELKNFKGHAAGIWSAAFSPDGSQIVSGSFDRTIRLWHVKTGKELKKIKGHTDGVLSVGFTPDGSQIISGSNDSTMRLWDLKTGEELRKFEGHTAGTWSTAFSPNGKWIVSGSFDRTIRLWDIKTGVELQKFEGHADGIWSVDFTPDGSRIVSGSHDRTIRIWDVKTGAELKNFEGHTERVSSVEFTADGNKIVSGSSDHTIRIWNVKTGKELKKLKGHTDLVWGVAISRDDSRIVSGSYDRTVRLWNAKTGAELRKFVGHTKRVMSVAISPDGSKIVSGSDDRSIRLWDMNTGEALKIFEGHTDRVWSVGFTPTGNRIVSGSYDRTIRLWNIKTGKEIMKLEHPDYSVGFSVTKDEKHLYATCKDGKIYKWDLKTQKIVKTYKGHGAWVNFVKLSPNEKYILSSADDQTVRIWGEQTGEQLFVFPTKEGLAIDWAPRGTSIVYGDKKEIQIQPFNPEVLIRNPEILFKNAELSAGKYLDGFQLKQMSREKFYRRKKEVEK